MVQCLAVQNFEQLVISKRRILTMFCLPIKCLILFLLLHVLAAINTTPRHTAYMYLVMMFLFHFVNCYNYMHVVIMIMFIKTIGNLILEISGIGKEYLAIAMTLLP